MKTKNYSHEAEIKTLTIPAEDLSTYNIELAINYYETELRWDSLINYRSILFNFIEEPSSSKEENKIIQNKWYQLLLRKLPIYLYFLIPKQFVDVIIANSLQQEDIAVTQSLENVVFDGNLKNYILESLEDMHRLDIAPYKLVKNIYEEVSRLIIIQK